MARPVPDMPRVPSDEEVDRSIGADLVARILAELPAHARQVLTWQVLVGCRPGEACGLRWDELAGDLAILRRGKTFRRTGQPRVIRLNAAARELIERQPKRSSYVFLNGQGEAYKPAGLRSIFKRAARRVGVEVTGTYQLRHSWAQAAYDSGLIGDGSLGELMGHRPNSPATKQYVKNRARRAIRDAEALGAPIPVDLPPALDQQTQGEIESSRGSGEPNRRRNAKGRRRRSA